MAEPTTPGDVIRELARAYFKAARAEDWNEPLTSRALKLADAVDKMTGLLRESTAWVPSKLHDRINAVLKEPTT